MPERIATGSSGTRVSARAKATVPSTSRMPQALTFAQGMPRIPSMTLCRSGRQRNTATEIRVDTETARMINVAPTHPSSALAAKRVTDPPNPMSATRRSA